MSNDRYAGRFVPAVRHRGAPGRGWAINGTRILLGIMLLLIGIASIIGVVVTARNGQTDAAIVIGIVAAAFFTRVGC